MKPFLKWAGGKYRIIDKVKAALPSGNRLVEPFAGAGAVFLNTDYPEYLVADANDDLINLFARVQTDGKEFIEFVRQFFTPANNNESSFYALREEFNATTDSQRKAALFLYLNRHCFNGLCRYNTSGKFNVPFGRYATPYFPQRELEEFYSKSRLIRFVAADFADTMKTAKRGDVVYCDPPYVPLTATANFTDYTVKGFGFREQQKLADLACELTRKGIPVIISNHDTAFTREAYSSAKLNSFDVQRFISSDGANRNKASELLAVFG